MSRTIEQKRAVFALGFIENNKKGQGKKEKEELSTHIQKELSTHIQKTPIRILQNGLGQALAFLLADDESEHNNPSYWLYARLQEWLCGQVDKDFPCRVYPVQQGQQANLMKQLVTGDRSSYLLAQEEALALFNWLKKFADAYLDTATQGAAHAGAAQPQP